MKVFLDVLLDVEFLKIALPAAAAILAWFLNERSKARAEQLQQKEERYKELLRCLKGFYVQNQDPILKNQFIDQAALCWLYASDDVIRKTKAFFSAIETRTPPTTNEQREKALADLILAIRRDMLNRRLVTRTALASDDWKSLAVNTSRTEPSSHAAAKHC